MKTNPKRKAFTKAALAASPKTHGGAVGAIEPDAYKSLRKQVMSCLLWEDTFYESGADIAQNIIKSCAKVTPQQLAELAIETRTAGKLRHVPLLLLTALEARRSEAPGLLLATAPRVLLRADELAEWVNLLCRLNGRSLGNIVLSKQARAALAVAFTRFKAYDLAKYNRDEGVRLRDVMFLCHPKPKDQEQAAAFKALADGKLESPDTWEVALSKGADKRATFERLIAEKNLGDLAFLRNLRGMIDAGVSDDLLKAELAKRKFGWVLPMRFVSAAKHVPRLEKELDGAMIRLLASQEQLPGRSLVVVDVSGSMGQAMSGKSELRRLDAAAACAAMIVGRAQNVSIYATAGSDGRRSHETGELPMRQGMALRDAIFDSARKLGGGGIFLVQCMDYIASKESAPFDRVFVITDEQDCDTGGWEAAANRAKLLAPHNYVMNIAPYKVGLDIGARWTRISGLSERIVDWAMENERTQ